MVMFRPHRSPGREGSAEKSTQADPDWESCQKPDPRDFPRLLRLGSKAKRQEHDAEGNTKNGFPHRFPLTPHVSPLALTSSLDPPERASTAESSGRSASPFLD